MERCPACNARLKKAVSCPRCKADLSDIISAEKTASLWFSKAIQYFQDNKIEQCINSLERSSRSKDSKTTRVFREYLIDYQCREVLDLLAQKRLTRAKQLLYRARYLLPHSKQLQQLNGFTDYLLVNDSQLVGLAAAENYIPIINKYL